MESAMREQIESVLEKVKPFLKIDGGDVEFAGIKDFLDPTTNTEKKIIEVRFLGACHGCPLNLMTLRAGIERALISSIPVVHRVEAVD
jgi:Thioredoxin-like proteins and domains